MTEPIGYRKFYLIRKQIPGRDSLEVTFPREVVDKEARQVGIGIEEFLEQYMVVCEYNGFRGVRYTFIKRSEQPNGSNNSERPRLSELNP